jgi:hypothetical protein
MKAGRRYKPKIKEKKAVKRNIQNIVDEDFYGPKNNTCIFINDGAISLGVRTIMPLNGSCYIQTYYADPIYKGKAR